MLRRPLAIRRLPLRSSSHLPGLFQVFPPVETPTHGEYALGASPLLLSKAAEHLRTRLPPRSSEPSSEIFSGKIKHVEIIARIDHSVTPIVRKHYHSGYCRFVRITRRHYF